MELFMQILGFLLVYIACGINRKPLSKIDFLSTYWFIQVALVTTGVMLYAAYSH